LRRAIGSGRKCSLRDQGRRLAAKPVGVGATSRSPSPRATIGYFAVLVQETPRSTISCAMVSGAAALAGSVFTLGAAAAPVNQTAAKQTASVVGTWDNVYSVGG
jgi:hypothetical protein